MNWYPNPEELLIPTLTLGALIVGLVSLLIRGAWGDPKRHQQKIKQQVEQFEAQAGTDAPTLVRRPRHTTSGSIRTVNLPRVILHATPNLRCDGGGRR